MRVLVCGGRNWTDTDFIYRTLDHLHKQFGFDVVIEGNGRGVDRMAGYWARKKRLDNIKFSADWKAHGRSAGPRRNQWMLDEGNPDLVVAFPGERGTADMVRKANAIGLLVIEIPAPEPV